MKRSLVFLSCLLTGFACARAATYTVLNTNASGFGSFAEALAQAESNAGHDTITFGGAVFLVPQTIELTAPVVISEGVTIVRPAGLGRVTFSADHTRHTIFDIDVLAEDVTISGLGLEGSDVPVNYWNHSANACDFTLIDCTFEDCYGSVVDGNTHLTIEGCTVEASYAPAFLCLDLPTVTLTDSTFYSTSGRLSPGSESGIDLIGGDLVVTNCTFSGFPGYGMRAREDVFYEGSYRGGPVTVSITGGEFSDNDYAVSIGGPLTASDAHFHDNTVAISATSLTLDGCTVEDNVDGVTCDDGVLTDCTIRRNSSTGLSGGFVDATDCVISANGRGARTGTNGASIFLRCTIANNLLYGGISGATVTITDSSITGNSSLRGGGVEAQNLTLTGCTVSSNNADDVGGGIYCDGTLTMTNCTISANSSDVRGGGLSIEAASRSTITNCTITGNHATLAGGGAASEGANVRWSNCIVAGNTSGTTSQPDDIYGESHVTLGHNLIGAYRVWYGAAVFVNGVNGDLVGTQTVPIDAVLGPLADNGGLTWTHALLAGSPAVEMGDSAQITAPAFPGPTVFDQRGEPRIVGGVVDMGAFEFPSLEVTNTNDSGAGSLRAAVDDANIGGGVITFRYSTFGAAIQTITLTSGQIAITAPVTISGPDVGVRISGGLNSRIFNLSGAGVVLRRLRITDGSSTNDGGGIRVFQDGANVTLEDVTVNDCAATGRGGGIYAQDNTVLAITRSTIFSNDANDNGGGINMQNNTLLRLTNSTLSGNRSQQNGGGLFAINGTFTLINCTVKDNRADFDATGAAGDGGGIRAGGGGGTVRVGNCIVAGNFDDSPGVQHVDVSGEFESLGHNLIGNVFGQDATGIPFSTSLGDLRGNNASPLDPLLNALAFTPAVAPTRVHTLDSASAAKDAGDNALLEHSAWGSAPGTDQRGQSRIVGGTVDIGAVEWPDAAIVTLERLSADASEYGFGEIRASVRVRRSFNDGTAKVVTMTVNAESTASPADYTFGGSAYAPAATPEFEITIPANRLHTSFDIVAVDDAIAEPVETVVVRTLNRAGYDLDGSLSNTRTLSIHDNEFLVTSGASSGAGTLREAIDAANASGGGTITLPALLPIALTGTPLTIDGAITIEGNRSTVDAGGMSRVFDIVGSGDLGVYLQNLIIRGGAAPSGEDGGGIRVRNRSIVTMDRCAVLENTAGSRGGGIFVDASLLTLARSSVHENFAADGDGGGIALAANATLIANDSTIARNSTTKDGGGLAVRESVVLLRSVTVAENLCDSDASTAGDGGGIFADTAGVVDFANTVIAGNSDTPGNSGSGTIHPDLSGPSTWIRRGRNFISANNGAATDFPAGTPGASGDHVGTLASRLDATLSANDDAHLFYTFEFSSLLRDGGASLWQMSAVDQRDYDRIANGEIDLGAVEMDFIVVTNTAASGTGSLRAAIDQANAAGAGDVFFDPTYFNVPRTIALGATGHIAVTAPITITGPIGAARRVTISGSGSSRVFRIDLPTTDFTSTYLRRLDFIDGNTATTPGSKNGGAIYAAIPSGSLIVRACNFTNNSSGVGAGALYFTGSVLDVGSCEFRGNQGHSGGAIAAEAARIEECVFEQNLAVNRGGALYLTASSTVEGCVFSTNRTHLNGGAIWTSSKLVLIASEFLTNRAEDLGGVFGSGGAIYCNGGQLSGVECVLSDNLASEGGAIWSNGFAAVQNSTFARNGATTHGGAIYQTVEAGSFANCTFSANRANDHGGAVFCAPTAGDPVTTFTHCTFTLNRANEDESGVGQAGAIFSGDIVALQNCIVAGNLTAESLTPNQELAGAFTNHGHNLIGNYTGSVFVHGASGCLVGVDPLLGILRYSGGFTPTHALLAGSPAIDAGVSTIFTTDQRGVARAGAPDMGAYEAAVESYAYWAAYTFPPGPATGPTADYDGDGIANAIEFGTGTDPLSGGSRPGIAITRSGGDVTFEFTAHACAPWRFVKLSLSDDLQTWTRVSELLYQFIAHDPANNRTRYRVTLPAGPLGRMFTRLETD